MARRTLSLRTRSLAAASIALAAFLGLTFVALDKAFNEAGRAALQSRLQSYMYAYLAAADTTRSGNLIAPETGPDPRFDRPAASGLYAAILGAGVQGSDSRQWRSPSAVGRALPFDQELPPGAQRFDGPVPTAEGDLYILAQGVEWSVDGRDALQLTFYVAEDGLLLSRQVEAFRQTLLIWLAGLAGGLLLLLMAVLRWSLLPLHKVSVELRRVELGKQKQLSGNYPVELSALAAGLNTFIEAERERMLRYRNTLADLAHSLKTPLAVMRSQLESDIDAREFRWTVLEQIGRMDEIVAYQLSRAAMTGHQTFAPPVLVEPFAEEIVLSLEKIHAARSILCEFDIAPNTQFQGAHGDLMEVLGNLLENAFKWARRRVMLTARQLPTPSDSPRLALEIIVEDDGPGIAEDRIAHVLQRGVRGDERVHGHGIGLAIVQDTLRAYRGSLQVTRSELGGARFVARFGVNDAAADDDKGAS